MAYRDIKLDITYSLEMASNAIIVNHWLSTQDCQVVGWIIVPLAKNKRINGYPRKHYVLDLIYREYISILECPSKNNEQDEVLSLGVFDGYDFYGRLP